MTTVWHRTGIDDDNDVCCVQAGHTENRLWLQPNEESVLNGWMIQFGGSMGSVMVFVDATYWRDGVR